MHIIVYQRGLAQDVNTFTSSKVSANFSSVFYLNFFGRKKVKLGLMTTKSFKGRLTKPGTQQVTVMSFPFMHFHTP